MPLLVNFVQQPWLLHEVTVTSLNGTVMFVSFGSVLNMSIRTTPQSLRLCNNFSIGDAPVQGSTE